MPQLRALIPDLAAIVGMHAADLAGYVLEVLVSAGPMERGIWNRRNFCMQVSGEYAAPGHGQDMAAYSALLDQAVTAIAEQFSRKNAANLFSGRGGKLIDNSKAVKATGGFDLITWLVIK